MPHIAEEEVRRNKSWISQRILNGLPLSENARRLPFSIAQQLLNPIAMQIQETYQQLNQASANVHPSSFNVLLPSHTWYLDIDPVFDFGDAESNNTEDLYIVPYVYGEKDSVEYDLEIAPNNDIETFIGNTLPTRIEYTGEVLAYQEVLPRTLVSGIEAATINDIVVHGHLYITVRDNATWRHEFQEYVYFPKVRITGITRKRTEVTEEVPVLQNGTFKTVNQWRSVSKIETYYLDDSAYVTVETFPFDAEYHLDSNNIYISENDQEMFQYFKLEKNSTYNSYDLNCYVDTVDSLDMAQALNFPKDNIFSINLESTTYYSGDTPSLVMSNFSNLAYVVNRYYFYMYDIRLPLPDNSLINEDDPESNIELYTDKWVVKLGDNAYFSTRLLDHTNPPFRFRIKLKDAYDEYWIGYNGTKVSIGSTDGWIQNERWEENIWEDKTFFFEIEEAGENVITFECLFSDETVSSTYTRKSQFMFFSPSIEREVSMGLPTALRFSSNVGQDSDGNLWFYISGSIKKAILRYDYFLVDYDKKRVWVREEYDTLKVESNA